MKNLWNITLIAGFLILTGCAGRRVIKDFQGDSSARASGVMTVRTGWLKNKKDSFDTELWFMNDHKGAISIPVGKISCMRNNSTGSMRFLSYATSALELEPGEQRKLIAICDVASEGNGPWTYTFKDVAVRTDDGSGKVLASSLTLKLEAAAQQ